VNRQLSCFCAAAALVVFGATTAHADEPSGRTASARLQPGGRPTVVLDKLLLPDGAPTALEKHLRDVLRREARRAQWGAGRGSRIEYRFTVKELSASEHEGVLVVRCAAVGKLPGNKTAKSSISFGGAPEKRRELLERVLEIVGRGVITRLSEMERARRGQAPPS
jgi:hypothetical protein